ncbi:MAG: hypothetical protein AAF926_01755, partial [Pseudomonadota bacterium]
MSIKTTWPFHVVLLPGFGCDDRLFEAQIDMFDHLGAEWSFEPLTRGISIREFAVRVLRSSNRPLALIGLSMG